jgi:hypothetical protein
MYLGRPESSAHLATIPLFHNILPTGEDYDPKIKAEPQVGSWRL